MSISNTNRLRWWGLQVVPVNFLLIIGELVLVGFGINQIHVEKLRQDALEPHDSAYIGRIVLIFSCIVLAVSIAIVLIEIASNVLLYLGLRHDQTGKVKLYFMISTVFAVLSSIGLILFYLTNVFELFYTSSQVIRMVVLALWTFRVLYTFLTNILIFRVLRYMTYDSVQSSLQDASL